MTDPDLSLFYDKQPDYVAFRNDEEKQKDYRIMVDWKVRNLTSLIPHSLKFGEIIEVGCAFGVLLNDVADRLHIDSRIGIDISPENIKTARSLFPQCNFFAGTLDDYMT